MHKRSALRCIGAAAGALCFPSVLASRRQQLVLGQSAALSGPAAQLGIQFRFGAKLCFDRVNAAGGVHGTDIVLKTLDDGYEPDRCAANTARFIDEGVFALFGYIGTPTSMAALPAVNRHRIPFLAPFTGARGLREPFNPYVFHVRASYADETERIVNQLHAVGMRRIAVFYQNDSYGQAGLEGVVRALAARGERPVATGTVERNTVDVDAAMASILPARPDGIVQVSAYRSCAAFVRAAKESGSGAQFCNLSFVGTAALAKELGAQARGVVVSQVMPYPFAPKTALAGEFIRAAAGRVELNYSSLEGYVAAKVLVEGLQKAGPNPSREALVVGLESLREHDLGGFFVDFSVAKHAGSRFVDLTILTGDGRVRQ